MITVLMLVAGLALLLLGGELLVRGAAGLALRFGLAPLLVGLTVVSFGTSSPELAVSVAAALNGQADIAVGNVIGSNIANLLLVLGLAAAVRPLTVAPQLVRVDVPVMLAASVATWVMALDGSIGRLEGGVLVAALVAYTILAVRLGANHRGAGAVPGGRAGARLVQIVAGLAALALGSRWMVSGAVIVARQIGVSELVVGLTVVAVGTSLPEIVASAIASLRGERDIAAGNVIGSNIFNLLCVLGLAAVVAPHGIAVSAGAIRVDLPIMIAVSVLAVPVLMTGRVVSRREGLAFLALYGAYVAFLVFDATHGAPV